MNRKDLSHDCQPLDTLRAEFDDLLAEMQRPKARKGLRAAFEATPENLGAAALKLSRAPRKSEPRRKTT
jgi:hypothetical protein